MRTIGRSRALASSRPRSAGSTERATRSARDGTFAFAALPETVSLTAASSDDEEPEVRTTVAIPEGGRQEITVRLPEPREPVAVSVVDDRRVAGRRRPADRDVALGRRSAARHGVHGLPRGGRPQARARGCRSGSRRERRATRRRVVVTDGSADTLEIELCACRDGDAARWSPPRGGEAVGGAEVTLYTDLGVRRARTDARGAFTLSELAPGPGAAARARAAGFAPAEASFAVPDSQGRRAVRGAEDRARRGRRRGRARSSMPAATPCPARASAQDHVPTCLLVGSNPEGVAVTDARGAFSLAGLVEGSVTLEAYAPDLGRGRARWR